ncbi:hypothetical protein D9M68_528510 [compost metagenome]
MHHTEESNRVLAGNGVIGIGHHDLGGRARASAADLFRIHSQCAQVIEYPGVVPGFFLDVFVNRLLHPVQASGHARTTGLHQRHGMADMVIGLAQECYVCGQRNLAA